MHGSRDGGEVNTPPPDFSATRQPLVSSAAFYAAVLRLDVAHLPVIDSRRAVPVCKHILLTSITDRRVSAAAPRGSHIYLRCFRRRLWVLAFHQGLVSCAAGDSSGSNVSTPLLEGQIATMGITPSEISSSSSSSSA